MAKKTEIKESAPDVVNDPVNESPMKRLSEFTEEKKIRVAEEMINPIGPALFEQDVIIKGAILLHGDSFMWTDIELQDPTGEGQYIHVLTNSPTIIAKMKKGIGFPVLARFTRREVRSKYRYDIQ